MFVVNFWICNRNYYVWVVYIACHDFNFNIFGSKTTISKHTFGCPTIKHSTSVLSIVPRRVPTSALNNYWSNRTSLIHRGVHYYDVFCKTSHSSFELETGWNQFGSSENFFCDFCCLDLAKVSFQKFKFFTSSLIDIRGLVGRVIFIKPFFVYLVCFAYYVRLNISFRILLVSISLLPLKYVTVFICYLFDRMDHSGLISNRTVLRASADQYNLGNKMIIDRDDNPD